MQNMPRKSKETNFMALLNFIVDPAFILDDKGRFLVVNDAFVDMIGVSKKKLVNMTFLDLGVLDPKNEEIALKKFRARMQGLTVGPYELDFTDKTGKERCVELKARKINYSGHPADLVIIHDITRRKENTRRLMAYSEKMEVLVNEKVKESEERFRELTESISDIFFAMDKDLKHTYWNKASEKVTGISAKDAIGKSLTEIFPNVKGTKVEQFYKDALRTKQAQSFVTNYSFGDKDLIFEINAYPTMAGLSVFVKDITKQKTAEKRLEKEQQELDCIIDSSPIIIFYKDKEGKFIRVNKAFAETLKTPKEKFLGKTVFDFYSAKIAQGMASDDSEVLKLGHPKLGIIEQYESASGIRWVQTDKVPIFDENGVPNGILGFAQDITERKKAEEALRSAENRFRNIFEQANDAFIYLDKFGKILDVNAKAIEVFGGTKEKLLGKHFTKIGIFSIKTVPVLMRNFVNILRGKEVNIEVQIKNTKQQQIDLECSATLLKTNKSMGIMVIARDITERKKMEDELKQERDTLEVVTENIGAGLVIISKDYRIIWANKFLKQIFGNIEQKLCYSTLHKHDAICSGCGAKKIFEKNATFDVHEIALADDKGNTQWIELIATPIKSKEGKVIAALELAVNITERKLLQDKLAEYSQQLEKLVARRTEELKKTQAKLVRSERLAAIGELAAMVGHDLRNPLTGIMGAAYYLKTKHSPELGAKGKEMLETIERAINHSNKIINDLLEYSRDLKLEPTETTPKTMLQSILSFLEVPENIQVVDATEDKPVVKADTEKMFRVFVNIIKNAVDAMPEGGIMTVKSREMKGKLEITFKDTGTGMSEETLEKLKRGTPLFTTKAKGMGFGLPICRRIVEAHGGKITVDSKIGKGTTVTVTIPVNPKPLDEVQENWIFTESMLSAITARQGKHKR